MKCEIPVSFEYEGIQFDGYFTNTHGAGYDRYFLILNGFHYGMVIISKEKWRWASGPMKLFEEPYMLEFFESVIVKWYDGQLS
jgi:hypothetical protein